MTILAARRVLPPDLITPAKASKPFMKETGPDAVPPPASSSREERSGERLEPVPEPYLKSMPSVLARVRIDSIRSSILLIKHALNWGRCSMPALNQTGLLKAAFWCTSKWLSSSRKISVASGVAKYPCLLAQPWMVRTTRPISCLTLRSRSGVPRTPRKYFETTTFVATCDQVVGISTSCCSKTTSPFSLVMLASRVSHWTSSNGATPGRVKYRFQGSPLRLRLGALLGAAAVTLGRSVEVFWVDRAIDEPPWGGNERGGMGGERPTSYAVGWCLSSILPQPLGFPDSAGYNICQSRPNADLSAGGLPGRPGPDSNCASPGPSRRPLLRR